MKKALPALLLLMVVFNSCKKDKNSALLPGALVSIIPTAATTAIKGYVSPAAAVKTIVVTDANDMMRLVTPDSNGIFAVSGLPAGAYSVKYVVTLAYAAKPVSTITLNTGQIADLGKVVFAPGFGTLEGTILPAGAAVKIKITNTATQSSYTAIPDASTGKYKFSSLPSGVYRVSYDVSAPAIVPADSSLTIGDNENIKLPQIILKIPGITGSISVTTSPIGIGSPFLLNTANNTLIYYTTSTAGVFTFSDLLPGTYVVSFPYNYAYQSVTLSPGQNIELRNLTLPKRQYIVPFTLNGGKVAMGAADAYCIYYLSKLKISASNAAAKNTGINNSYTTIQMSLDNVNGPGTYILQGTSTSFMTYTSGPQFNLAKWGLVNGSTATVIINNIDPVLRLITGSFSARLSPLTNASGDLVITDGIINLTY